MNLMVVGIKRGPKLTKTQGINGIIDECYPKARHSHAINGRQK